MNFELRFSDKEITAWGGMALMKRMLDHMEFDQALAGAGLPQPRSNRGYAPSNSSPNSCFQSGVEPTGLNIVKSHDLSLSKADNSHKQWNVLD